MSGIEAEYPSVRNLVLGLWQVFVARIRWIILALAVAVVLAIAIIRFTEPTYRSSSTISLDITKLSSLNDEIVPTSFLADDLIIDTEIKILGSRGLAERTLTRTNSYDALGGTTTDQELQRQNALQNFRRNLKIEREGATALVTVYFQSQNPDFSALISDSLVASYIEFKREQQIARMTQYRDYLSDELSVARARLNAAQVLAQNYARTNNLEYGSGKTLLELNEEVLKRNQIDQAMALQTTLQTYKSLARLISTDMDPSDLHGPILVQHINTQIAFVQNKYVQAQLERSLLEASGLELPTDSTSGRNITILGQALIDMVHASVESAKTDLDLSQEKLDETIAQYDAVKRASEQALVAQSELQRLKDNEAAIREQFDLLNAQLEASSRQSDYFQPPAALISQAIPPHSPHTPNSKRILLSTTVLMFALASLAIMADRHVLERVEFKDDLRHEAVTAFDLRRDARIVNVRQWFTPRHRRGEISASEVLMRKVFQNNNTRQNQKLLLAPITAQSTVQMILNKILNAAETRDQNVTVVNFDQTVPDELATVHPQVKWLNPTDDVTNIDPGSFVSNTDDFVVIVLPNLSPNNQRDRILSSVDKVLIPISTRRLIMGEYQSAIDGIANLFSGQILVALQNG